MTHNHRHNQSHDQFSQHYVARAQGSRQHPVMPRQGAPSPRPRQPTGYASHNAYIAPPQSVESRQRVAPRRRQRPQRMWLAGGFAGGGFLALTTLLINPSTHGNAKPVSYECQERVQAQAVLSRDELSALLSIPERASRDAVREVIAEPYCLLSPVEVREGVPAEREVYPLAFDPQTWFVVLYEEGEYAGYDFSFRRE